MSSTDEPMATPDEVVIPTTSYEVVQESYEAPTPSFESLQADTSTRPSIDTTQLSDGNQPTPHTDHEQRNTNSNN